MLARACKLTAKGATSHRAAKAFSFVEKEYKLLRCYLPLKPQNPGETVWSVIPRLTGKIGESLTTYLHDIANANPALEGVIDRMDFNATTRDQATSTTTASPTSSSGLARSACVPIHLP